MVAPRQRAGFDAEARAEAYLGERGLQPIDRNVRFRGGEIDLVMRERDLIVFVEVRTVTSDFLESPVLSVNPSKQGRVGRAADVWLRAQGAHPERIRFDVAGVRIEGESHHIDYVENAFVPAFAW